MTDRRVAVLSSAAAGGAGIAARRFADALAERPGLAVDLIDTRALGGPLPEDVAPARSFSNRTISDVHFTVETPGYSRGAVVTLLSEYDLVNVHWTATLVSLAELDLLSRRGGPLVFTLHDFFHVSGGCHYPGPCGELVRGCIRCPQIDRTAVDPVLPARNRRIKAEILARSNVNVVAPSRYVRDRAVLSGIVPAERAHVLRNPHRALAEPRMRPTPTTTLRVLLIADHLRERRKNMAVTLEGLVCATPRLTAAGRRVVVDLVGGGAEAAAARLATAGIAVHTHGRIADAGRLAALLRAADLVPTASTEDNWPNVLVEAGVYGAAPVVGLGHGTAEFVATFGWGAVAADHSAGAFADAIVTAAASLVPDAAHAAAMRVRAAHDPAVIGAAFAALFGL